VSVGNTGTSVGATTTGTSTTGTSTTGSTTTAAVISNTGNAPASTNAVVSNTGGTSAGGSNTGGTSAGGSNTGGTSIGGSNTGGSNVSNNQGSSLSGTGASSFGQYGRFSSTALSGTLALSYNIYTSGGRNASIRAAEEQVRYDQLGVETQSQQLRLDVSTITTIFKEQISKY
jgi:outer membrane protein TolC